MKTLFSILYYVFIVDLILAKYENEKKTTEKDILPSKSLTAVSSLGNGQNADEEYFIGVNDGSVILLVKENLETGYSKKVPLKVIDSKELPSGFHPEDAECSFVVLPANDSAFLCAENVPNGPECLLISVSGHPYSRIESIIPVSNDYTSKNLWNTLRLASEDGRTLITAYLNTTAVYDPGWIIRQRVDENTLITVGSAIDHRLGKLKNPYMPMENVYAFRYGGFAYLLRYAYRFKHMNGDAYEWIWQLTRVCFNDQTKELRSRISIPLSCDFPTNTLGGGIGWRATDGYLDEKNGHLYVYSQPNVSISGSEQLPHRICAFDMKMIINEFERTFNRCYHEYSPSVAAHGALPMTMSCSSYREAASDIPCHYDLCNSGPCIVGAFYHLEVYEAISGTPVATISQSGNVPYRPIEMYVTTSDVIGRSDTTQAFIQGSNGKLFMVFLNDSNFGLGGVYPPAWTSDYTNGEHHCHMLELPDRDGVQLITDPDSGIYVLKASCSIYSRCDRLMERSTGEQARRLWGCGWCENENGGFGSTKEECNLEGGHFHKDTCPPAANCFHPRTWLSKDNVSLAITGHFPRSFGYKVTACGAECRDVKITSEKLENKLHCTATPPYHVDGQVHPSCGVEISVIDSVNTSSILYTLRPTCSNDTLFPATVHGIDKGPLDTTLWIVVATGFSLLGLSVLIFAVRRAYHRRNKRREGYYNSLSLPTTVAVELSRNNEYIQRSVHRGNQLILSDSETLYDDLSHMVPQELLINFDKIELGSELGKGHFGHVFKGSYTPQQGEMVVPVAVKTPLIGERNARHFLQEGIIMETFDHPNVLSLIGISFSDSRLPMIITPYMEKGDLLSYIRNPDNRPSVGQLLRFGVEIAEGMQYLHKLKFIHRDLAARNCMLDDNLHVKVADFGLSRDVYESECYLSSYTGDLPIRWMALESIERREYTSKSDVWSYGVVLWELTTRGEMPYAGMRGVSEVLTYLKTGRRLSKPIHCPESVYEIIRQCWLLVPADRPDFLTLSETVPAMIQALEESSSSSHFTAPTYYNVSPIIEEEEEQVMTAA